MSAELSYEFVFGTYEEGLKMVGYRSEPRVAATAVSGARIQMFAATIQDANPGYWDVDFAAEVWGGLIAPPALLMGWLIPTPWQPTGQPPMPSLAIRIPLPGTTFINASNEVEYFDPILEGDRLTVWTGTQRPFGVRRELADAFHLPEEQIRVIVPDTGAGYGGKHSGETAVEAARLARAARKPVKLVWTREEEFTWAYFRPAGVIDIRSANYYKPHPHERGKGI